MLDSTKEFNEVKIYTAVFWYIFTMLIVTITAYIIGDVYLLNNSNLLSLISTTLFIFVLFYKFKVKRNKLSLLIKDYFTKINIKEIFGIVVTQLCLSMSLSLLLIGIIYFTSPNMLNKLLSQSSVDEVSTYSGLFISMLITVIGAPLMEELLFRAIIFKRISRKFNIYLGMILSSLIFGSLHIELAIIGAFLFGIACCILYIKYKNILIPMTVHFLNNFLSFFPQLDINSPVDSTPITSLDARISIISGSLLFLIGMYFFIKFIFKNKSYLKEGFSPRIDEKLNLKI